MSLEGFSFNRPRLEDGPDVSHLISKCPPLDQNSAYCNLLQCLHFASTSVAVRRNGELVGFVSGYLIPDQPDSLFIWQVAVCSSTRGFGLATQMINHILGREHCQAVNYIQTTITEANKASWSLFNRIAAGHSTLLTKTLLFERDKHFVGNHDSEVLATIGPLQR